jgi:transposase
MSNRSMFIIVNSVGYQKYIQSTFFMVQGAPNQPFVLPIRHLKDIRNDVLSFVTAIMERKKNNKIIH